MAAERKRLFSRRIPRLAVGAIIAVTAYFVLGFLVLPSIVRSVAIKKLSERLDRPVEIKSVEINPFALSVTVSGIAVKTKDGSGTTVSADSVYVNAEALSLLKGAVVVREFTVVRPYVNVIRREDGTYNFSYLIPKKKEEEKEPEGAPLRFSVSNIRVTGGSADFFDRPTGAEHQVRELEFDVPFVSNMGYYGDSYVRPFFSAVVNGTPVTLEGKTRPFTDQLETDFKVKVDKFDIPRYFEYVPVETPVRVPGGSLYLDLDLSYVQFKDGRPPTIGVTGDASVVGLVLTDREGRELASLKRFAVSVSSSDLMAKSAVLSSVLIESPAVNIVRDEGGMNLMKLAGGGKPEKPEKPAEPEDGGGGKEGGVSLELNFLKLTDGRVSFTDRTRKRPFAATVSPIDVTLVNLKTIRDWKAQLSLSLATDAGETVTLDSHVGLIPVSINGTLDVRGVPLTRYSPYYPDNLLVDVRSGVLGVLTKFSYSSDEAAPEQRISELSVNLESLKLRKKGEPADFADVPEFRIADTSADALSGEVVLGSIKSSGGRIAVARDKEGRVNLATLVKKEEIKPLGAGPQSPAKPAAKTGPAWTVTVADADIGGYAIDVEDMAAATPVVLAIRKAAVTARGVTTKKGVPGEVSLSCDVGKTGRVGVKGKAVVDPPSAELDVKVKELDIKTFQPYIPESVPMVLTSARFSADGRASVSVKGEEGPSAAYRGDLSLAGFSAVDRVNAERMLEWQNLYFTGADVGYNPTHADIKKVSLTDFYAKVVVNEDRSLNVMPPKKEEAPEGEGEAAAAKAANPSGQSAPAQEKKASPVKVGVDAITLQGGRMDFTDRSVSPRFAADLTKMGGRISGLSSMETKYAEVDLGAVYNGFAPIEITGKIQPLRESLFVDLKADLKDMDLSPLTPYSGKYLGYTIEKGKLNMDLRYKIEQKELDAENKIFIDQFYLGEPVESPDATSLPVKLALALLRDRNGEIHLDVPLAGRTDDPEFSYGGIILQVIWNILTKAATSPFALLGAIFGGGEDLGYVEFGYASSALDGPAKSKIDMLSKSLYERPALKLGVTGHVDVERDRDALRTLFFNRKVKAQKLKDMIDEGMEPVPVDEVVIAPEEYDEYLEDAYDDEDFPKPRNILGFAKSLPPEEMTKLMLTNLKVTDDDLRKLASERAAAVKTELLGLGQVEQEQVFVTEPESLAPEKEEDVKDSRVVFSLE